jgi:hypothetical protein
MSLTIDVKPSTAAAPILPSQLQPHPVHVRDLESLLAGDYVSAVL